MHEFATLPGVVEDVTDIVLNLKKVLFKLPNREPRVLFLNVNKEGAVTAGDIQLDANVEVLNPDQVICTLDKKSKLRGRARGQGRPRLRQRGIQQARRAGHRRHRHRLALLARAHGEVRGGEHPRRPAHRLRQAHPRNLDRRPHHARRRAHAGLRHPAPSPRRVRRLRQGDDRIRGEPAAGQPGKQQAQEAAQHERQRNRAVGPRRELPEQREHHHRRPARA